MGVQFVGHTVHLWWDGVCDIRKFWPARTDIKGVISALLLHLLLPSRTERNGLSQSSKQVPVCLACGVPEV